MSPALHNQAADTAQWEAKVLVGHELVVDAGDEPRNGICPDIASLERRYEASSKNWLQDWIRQDEDVAQAE